MGLAQVCRASSLEVCFLSSYAKLNRLINFNINPHIKILVTNANHLSLLQAEMDARNAQFQQQLQEKDRSKTNIKKVQKQENKSIKIL